MASSIHGNSNSRIPFNVITFWECMRYYCKWRARPVFSVFRISGRECIFKNIWKINYILVQLALGNFSKLRLWRFINGQFIMIRHSAIATPAHAATLQLVVPRFLCNIVLLSLSSCVWFGCIVSVSSAYLPGCIFLKCFS